MISTNIMDDGTTIIVHQLTGSLTKSDALIGSDNAISVVKDVLKSGRLILLVIDVKDYIFNNVEAHRVWALNFKENAILTDNVARVALIGKDEPKFHAEKEHMESETLGFFTEREMAFNWLKNA